MNPPTYKELLEFIDGTLEPSRYRELDRQISQSVQLQREIALLRKIEHSVRETRSVPNRHFTENVMSEITPTHHMSVWYRMAKNSSNVFALAVVLTMIGFALISTTGNSPSSLAPLVRVMDSAGSTYQSAAQAWTQWMKQAADPIGAAAKTGTGKILLIGSLIFLFYAAIDEMIGKRFTIRK